MEKVREWDACIHTGAYPLLPYVIAVVAVLLAGRRLIIARIWPKSPYATPRRFSEPKQFLAFLSGYGSAGRPKFLLRSHWIRRDCPFSQRVRRSLHQPNLPQASKSSETSSHGSISLRFFVVDLFCSRCCKVSHAIGILMHSGPAFPSAAPRGGVVDHPTASSTQKEPPLHVISVLFSYRYSRLSGVWTSSPSQRSVRTLSS